MSSTPSAGRPTSYKQATGQYRLLGAFDAIFTKGQRESNLKTAKILKTLVSNARTKRDPKYQTIYMDNPRIQDHVANNEAAMDVLQTVGFIHDSDKAALVYTPTETLHFQFASRLESMLEAKIAAWQKVDTSTGTQKEHKAAAKARTVEAKLTRQQQIVLWNEDRERQQMFPRKTA
jgi:PUB domain